MPTTLDPQSKLTSAQAEAIRGYKEFRETDIEQNLEEVASGISAYGSISLTDLGGDAWSAIEKSVSLIRDTAVETPGAVLDIGKILIGKEDLPRQQNPEEAEQQIATRFHRENFFQHLKTAPEEGDTLLVNGKPMKKEDALKLYGVIPSYGGITDGRGNVNTAAATAIENKQSDTSQEQREADRSQALVAATKPFMRQGEMLMGTESKHHFTQVAG